MDYRTLARAITSAVPDMGVYDVLALADSLLPLFPVEPVKVDVSDAEALGAYALSLANVVAAAQDDRKIVAIKELRQSSNAGLLEAKNALESRNFTRVYPNMVSSVYRRPGSNW